jgi:hypothetical protein
MKMRSVGMVVAALVVTGVSHALPIFQGRNSAGAVDNTCTVSGASKCAMFYDTTLDITILNNWNIGRGNWSATGAAGSAQELAESAGLAATGLSGWVLPTENGSNSPGAANQFLSIWNDVGGSLAGLAAQFDGVQSDFFYWSSTESTITPGAAWAFLPSSGFRGIVGETNALFAVAVRSGDVTATSVPEPGSFALTGIALACLAVTAAASKRRIAHDGSASAGFRVPTFW